MATAGQSYLMIGRITAPHGLKGAVRVQSLSDDSGRFLDLEECLLLSADETAAGTVVIQSARQQNGGLVIVQLAHYDDRTAAETLRGHYLAVKRDQAIQLGPDRWFICDLIGCAVYDELDGCLGTVSDVLQHTAQDVYVVHRSGEPDLLFPALKQILLRVDLEDRRIDVRLPAGLYEIYRERHD